MENCINFALAGLSTVFCFPSAYGQAIQFIPQFPAPGAQITITYQPDSSSLAQVDELEAIVYHLSFGNPPNAREIAFERNANGIFVGELETNPEAKVLFVRLRDSESDQEDNNSGKGYHTFFYQENATKPVEEAQLTLAEALSQHAESGLLGIEPNPAGAAGLLKGALSETPGLIEQERFWPLFGVLAWRLEDDEALEEVRKVTENRLQDSAADEASLLLVLEYYRTIGERSRSKALRKRILEDFPTGELAYREAVEDLREIADFSDKESAYEELLEEFFAGEMTPRDREKRSALAREMAESCSIEQLDVFWYYQNLVDEERTRAGREYRSVAFAKTLHRMARQLAGDLLNAPAPDLGAANNVSRQSLQAIRDIINEAPHTKPPELTIGQYLQLLNKEYGRFADTHANILYKMDDHEDALKYQEIALENVQNDPAMKERKAVYLQAVEGPQAAKVYIEELIRSGYYSEDLNKQLEQIFKMEVDQDYKRYRDSLRQVTPPEGKKKSPRKNGSVFYPKSAGNDNPERFLALHIIIHPENRFKNHAYPSETARSGPCRT